VFTGLYAIKLIPSDFDEECVPLDFRNVHSLRSSLAVYRMFYKDLMVASVVRVKWNMLKVGQKRERENVCAFYSFLNVKRRICCD